MQADASDSLPAPTDASWQRKERTYLALLNLAPQFNVPCRPDGALRDLAVSKHRNGPRNPWRWAIHRLGARMLTYVWDGSRWNIIDDPASLLEHASWDNPLPALAEAQRIAQEDERRGYADFDRWDD